MLDGLVAMGILPHVFCLHLLHLMYHVAVIAWMHRAGERKHGVKFGCKRLVTAKEVDESLNVMKHRPYIMPGIAFGIGSAPSERVERCNPRAILMAATHEMSVRIPQIAVVVHLPAENLLIKRIACRPCQLVGAEVVVGIFQSLRHTAMRFGKGHIAQGEIVLPSYSAV